MAREHRHGAEFSATTKELTLMKANGLCQNPQGCNNFNNGRVDHITSCLLGQLIGMDRSTLKHPDNAQVLCDGCDYYKTTVLEPIAISREVQRMRFLPSWINRASIPSRGNR